MQKPYAPAKMDAPIMLTTMGVTALFSAFIAASIFVHPHWGMLLPAGLVLTAMIITWLGRPRSYVVGDKAILVIRANPYKDIEIPFELITQARRVAISRSLSETRKKYGNGGLFGWSGSYWNREIGEFFAAATSSNKTVLIEAGHSLIITPEDPDAFVADLCNKIKG